MAKRRPYLPATIELSETEMKKIVAQAKGMKPKEFAAEIRFLVDSGYTVKFAEYREAYQVTITEKSHGEDGTHMFLSTRSKDPLLSLHATVRKLEACEDGDLRNAKAETEAPDLFI